MKFDKICYKHECIFCAYDSLSTLMEGNRIVVYTTSLQHTDYLNRKWLLKIKTNYINLTLKSSYDSKKNSLQKGFFYKHIFHKHAFTNTRYLSSSRSEKKKRRLYSFSPLSSPPPPYTQKKCLISNLPI